MKTKQHLSLPQGPNFQETPPGTTWPEAPLPHLQKQTASLSDILSHREAVDVFTHSSTA